MERAQGHGLIDHRGRYQSKFVSLGTEMNSQEQRIAFEKLRRFCISENFVSRIVFEVETFEVWPMTLRRIVTVVLPRDAAAGWRCSLCIFNSVYIGNC